MLLWCEATSWHNLWAQQFEIESGLDVYSESYILLFFFSSLEPGNVTTYENKSPTLCVRNKSEV